MAEQTPPQDPTPSPPANKWRALPPRVEPADMVASVPPDPQPSVPSPVGDPQTNFLLRHA